MKAETEEENQITKPCKCGNLMVLPEGDKPYHKRWLIKDYCSPRCPALDRRRKLRAYRRYCRRPSLKADEALRPESYTKGESTKLQNEITLKARKHKIARLEWKAMQQFKEIGEMLFWLRDWLQNDESQTGFFSKYENRQVIKQRLVDCINLLLKPEPQNDLPETNTAEKLYPEVLTGVLKDYEEELKAERNPGLARIMYTQSLTKKKRSRRGLNEAVKEEMDALYTLEECLDSIAIARSNIAFKAPAYKKYFDAWGKKDLLLWEINKLRLETTWLLQENSE